MEFVQRYTTLQLPIVICLFGAFLTFMFLEESFLLICYFKSGILFSKLLNFFFPLLGVGIVVSTTGQGL